MENLRLMAFIVWEQVIFEIFFDSIFLPIFLGGLNEFLDQR